VRIQHSSKTKQQARLLIRHSIQLKDGKICKQDSIEASLLQALMGQCTDSEEDTAFLQFLGKQLGLRVLFTPKFHCEFVGEGIEYNWAHARAK
jgi:hypothetical protein